MTTMRTVVLGLTMLGGVLPCGVAGAQAAPAAPERKVTITIAAQPLGKALNEWASQTGYQVLLPSRSETGGRMAPALTGSFTPEAALQQLLLNSGLKYEFVAARTVSIRVAAKGESASGMSPGEQMLLAGGGAAAAPQVPRAEGGKGRDDAEVIVRDRRNKPYEGASLDLPRTIDDVQPYYIFDAKDIERSGATSLEDFLKRNLTMNATAQTAAELGSAPGEGRVDVAVNGEDFGQMGATSAINLRGLGADKTLVLVNGRRMAGVPAFRDERGGQTDINGIAPSMVERIEVLPSSASGIYGGSAMGGVINIILKRNYSGGEMRLKYDNSFDTDAASRSASLNYGFSIEEGRTQIQMSASWSDIDPMLLRDRREDFEANRVAVGMTGAYDNTLIPAQGSVPNIISTPTFAIDFSTVPFTIRLVNQNLRLKNGQTLDSPYAHIPAGTAPGTALTALYPQLLPTAGRWNFEMPDNGQSPFGLYRPFGMEGSKRSFNASVSRRMNDRLELSVDVSRFENDSWSMVDVVGSSSTAITVPRSSPVNPFDMSVNINFPVRQLYPQQGDAVSSAVTFGARMRLPRQWTGLLDYTWSRSEFSGSNYRSFNTVRNAALASGALNPFVDTMMYAPNLDQFVRRAERQGKSDRHGVTLRASGQVTGLPWASAAGLTLGLEHGISDTPARTIVNDHPVAADVTRVSYFARDSESSAAYVEALVPLVRQQALRGVHSLELQLSGRMERFTYDVGTNSVTEYYNRVPPLLQYGGATTAAGEPFSGTDTWSSRNYTLGIKYQPVDQLTFRVSRATAFLPPLPSQLTADPDPAINSTEVVDPRLGGAQYFVDYFTGGNPALKPQNSISNNAGLIWFPAWTPLEGLRVNLEYYRIRQFDVIQSPGAAALVLNEDVFPGRVQRDPVTSAVTLVDNSLLNLFKRETSGYDISLAYPVRTALGQLRLNLAHTTILALKQQLAADEPDVDAAGFHPFEGGGSKYKSTASLDWERGAWTAGWSVSRTGSYQGYGAAGGPYDLEAIALGTTNPYAALAAPVAAQLYHDLRVGYAPQTGSVLSGGLQSLLEGTRMQLSISNVFDALPPGDRMYSANYYFSPYGNLRKRSYWLSAARSF